MATSNANTAPLPTTPTPTAEWEKPDGFPNVVHAHFDCFSGCAGDMILAACLDAAAGPDSSDALLRHITLCLQKGLPDLCNDFDIVKQRVWRGRHAQMAATHVTVKSRYNHAPAPVPQKDNAAALSTAERNKDDAHNHEHAHHSHHDHTHGHGHGHGNNHEEQGNGKETSIDQDAEAQAHAHSHSHGHGHQHEHEHQHGHHHQRGHDDNDDASTLANGPLRNLPEIRRMLLEAPEGWISVWVRETAITAFTMLAEAEATVHGATSKDAVHFHEVGAVDSIVDTVGSLLALEAWGVKTVTCSPLPAGRGHVNTAHGVLPVPAPATLRLMMGMPLTPGPPGWTGELVTPTGAALLRALTAKKTPGAPPPGRPPAMTLHAVGIGAGTKDFEQHPNILRLWLGQIESKASAQV